MNKIKNRYTDVGLASAEIHEQCRIQPQSNELNQQRLVDLRWLFEGGCEQVNANTGSGI